MPSYKLRNTPSTLCFSRVAKSGDLASTLNRPIPPSALLAFPIRKVGRKIPGKGASSDLREGTEQYWRWGCFSKYLQLSRIFATIVIGEDCAKTGLRDRECTKIAPFISPLSARQIGKGKDECELRRKGVFRKLD